MLWQLLKYRLLKQKRLVILDAPLLYETGILQYFCYPIVVVSCSPSIQKERLMKRDTLDDEQATARIDAQMPLEVGKAGILAYSFNLSVFVGKGQAM